jgi:hypothetical protein
MAMHAPSIHLGTTHHHLYRDALLVIGVVALAVVLLLAALTIRPATVPTTSTGDQHLTQQAIEFRAAERALLVPNAPLVTGDYLISKAAVDFRAAERELK